ncbi:SGNH/GDSL hydrolase family protein [Arthrobacter burdickii]|uniref:SGNH/GDSL hydrolase family protein n=1 Tax=Arthrobacter burdickii TaxID=3035920 RepID=A0ABT8JW88_9MICC|nr:SGNH/GDSL hydrolase family protein [Arthrobacter burdickii]MDN4609438.1 SGNH/GDSL hydrolase family protein [Arthrobacter burdickii]
MGHVVLLGDSIFDNGRYVDGGPDVVEQVRDALPQDWKVTLLAVDGDVTSGVARQLRALPPDATHLVVSVGGNDALGYQHLLQRPVRGVADALLAFSAAQQDFARDYDTMTDAVTAVGLPTAVCTIYDTPSSEPGYAVIRTALAFFNDCITRAAFSRGVSVVDLRLVCDDDGDYANPIEPSVQGGRKIAAAISAFLLPEPAARLSAVIAR